MLLSLTSQAVTSLSICLLSILNYINNVGPKTSLISARPSSLEYMCRIFSPRLDLTSFYSWSVVFSFHYSYVEHTGEQPVLQAFLLIEKS